MNNLLAEYMIFFGGLILFSAFFAYFSFFRGPRLKWDQVVPIRKGDCIFPPAVANIERAKVSVGNAWATLHECRSIGEPSVKFDPLFRGYMNLWVVDETMDVIRAALMSLRSLSDESFINGNKEKFLTFVNSCFNEKEGGYSIAPNMEASIYASSNAIEAIKYVLGKKENEGLGKEGIEKLGEEKIKSIEDFLKKCKGTMGNFRCIYNNPKKEKPDIIFLIYLVRRLLWSLEKRDKFFETIDVEKLIKDSYREGGFALNPLQNEAGITCTFFALSLICGNEPYEGILSAIKDEFFVEKRDQISQFIYKCWNDQSGSFGASVDSLPTLQSTFFALRTLELLKLEVKEEKIESIRKFVELCYSKGGGYGISIHPPLNEPSAHGTRWALQIDYLFSKQKRGVLISGERKEETKNFLHKLYNPETGGFSGFLVPIELKKSIKRCPLIDHVLKTQYSSGFQKVT